MKKLDASDLTFIAEKLGLRSPPPLRWLKLLARHTSPLVREGAVNGLAPHIEVPWVHGMLRSIMASDSSKGVREAAQEALES